MGKTSKEIFREPAGEGSDKEIVAKVDYWKDARVRGYYFSAIVVREIPRDGYTSTEWVMGEGSKRHFVREAKRFNARDLEQIKVSDELIAQVKQESRDSIRPSVAVDSIGTGHYAA